MISTLPHHHIESLREIEKGYWWFSGRVYWATRLLKQAQKSRGAAFHRYADLGCGVGGFAEKLDTAFQFRNVLLVDGDKKILEQIPNDGKTQFIERDLQKDWKLPFHPDLISCMDVLEHLENDDDFLKHVYESLQKGGVFLLTVPNHSGFYSYWDRAVGHYRRYDRKSLEQKLKGAGFKIISLTPMWSFLIPFLLWRKMRNRDSETPKATFPHVPDWLNGLLFFLCQCEWPVRNLMSFGTSLIACCEKL